MSWEEEVILRLEGDIRALARRWSRDNRDDWEDLAQEARIGIYQELKEKPDSPRTYLFRRAKHEILDYRKKGRSVDGKLDKTYKREFVWDLVSLDADPVSALADGNNLYFRPKQLKPVEELAIVRVVYSELRHVLSNIEDIYLSLRLQGYTNTEAYTLLGLSRYQASRLRESIQGKAGDCFYPGV